MLLKKIKVFGFKSFADSTTLEFHPGITAVVGPNGCGKSNIADAFRWVLGEQSAKSMRGHKMHDVIFAGTSTRKALNFAEVTLVIDNSDNSLPIEYAEVAVTRRLYRSGESEYSINGHTVRLKDVHNLLLDSGMGKDAYSIFEQGKIDQVINYSSDERRYIFEEASGIIRFLQRKKEALRKLEQSDQNLSRVKDIHQEVEKQIVILEEQAEKARLYKEHKKELEILEKAVFVAKHENLFRKCEDFFLKDDQLKEKQQEIRQDVDAIKKEIYDAKVLVDELEMALRKQSEVLYKTRSDKEIKLREKQTSQERIKESLQKQKKWKSELEEIHEKRKHRLAEKNTLEKQQKELEKRLEKMLVSSNEKLDTVQELEKEVTLLREKQQNAQKELLQLLQKESSLESELKQNIVRQDNNQEQKKQLSERQKRLLELAKELETQVNEKKELLEEAKDTVDTQREKLTEKEETFANITKELVEIKKTLETLQVSLVEKKARFHLLNRLKNEMEGFSLGSKRLLQESQDTKSLFYKKIKGLYEYFTIDKKAEKALSLMMKPYAQTLVVETKDVLKEVLQFAEKNKLKDFSCFCLESAPTLSENNNKNKLDKLINHVTGAKETLHFLDNCLMAKDFTTAEKLLVEHPGMNISIEDGSFLDSNGVYFSISLGENNVFLREAELKTLDSAIHEEEDQKTSIESKLNNLNQQKDALHLEKTELDKLIRREEMKLVEVNFALQRTLGDLEKAKIEITQFETENKSIIALGKQLNQLIENLSTDHESAKKSLEEARSSSAKITEQVEEKSIILKEALKLKQEKETETFSLQDENRKLLHTLNVLDVKENESLSQEERLLDEIENASLFQDDQKNRSTSFDEELENTEESLNEAKELLAEKDKATAEAKQSIKKLEVKLAQTEEKSKTKDNEINQVALQLAQIEQSRNSLEADILERYQLTIDEAKKLNLKLDKPLDQAEKEIRSIRQKIESSGDINMTSIEEFERYKERYKFLNDQMGDLDGSKGELLAIIKELDDESRKMFTESFEIIRRNFQKNFKILFNGGESDLQFIGSEDVLEAGIDIIAKPPGKQMRSINLLSGGEKCLTALALLFAIFEVKPSPFCILDEIDAPLDDTNVERFVNIVKQFIDKCQFIIITHNKITMSIADMLFGVSMQEKGVSKLLSIAFSKNERPQPALIDT